jgi:adenosylcobinamide-GDP ribazoletransferase
MKLLSDQELAPRGHRLWRSLAAAVAFYTCLPIPSSWALEFQAVARWAPVMGLLIGGLLGLGDAGLQQLGIPMLTRSALVIVAWIALTAVYT